MSTTSKSTTSTKTEDSKRATTKAASHKRDLYQETTDKIIGLLETSVLPWRRTWSQYGLARNFASGTIYKGINMVLMNNTTHSIPYFMSFKQIKQRGGMVKKGAKAEQVLCFKLTFKDADGKVLTNDQATQYKKAGKEVKVLRFLKYFSVFNIADVEGIEIEIPVVSLKENEQIEQCESLIQDMRNPPIFETVDTDRAYYSPVLDQVNMPSIRQFDSSAAYYAILFHEIVHSTGHEKRLNRKGITELTNYGTAQYSKEELIAEMGAAFLCASVGIDYDVITENTAAYIQGWLKVLKADKHFIFQAAAQAQKAVNYILKEEATSKETA